jgi:hypothetical protein
VGLVDLGVRRTHDHDPRTVRFEGRPISAALPLTSSVSQPSEPRLPTKSSRPSGVVFARPPDRSQLAGLHDRDLAELAMESSPTALTTHLHLAVTKSGEQVGNDTDGFALETFSRPETRQPTAVARSWATARAPASLTGGGSVETIGG